MQIVKGIIQLSEVKRVNLKDIPRFSTGIKELDSVCGGIRMGETSVFTGKRGHGKSTMCSQLMNEAIDQDFKVCAYSGELQASAYQRWAHNQMLGTKFLDFEYDKFKDAQVAYSSNKMDRVLQKWYHNKYFIFDNTLKDFPAEQVNIIKVFEEAHEKLGCNVFLADNLMVIKSLSPTKERDFYRAQSEFMLELMRFSKRTSSHVMVVAHPRKTDNELTDDDVAGSGDIINSTDNLFIFERLFDDPSIAARITVKKNRIYGDVNARINLTYDPDSKRFAHYSRPENLDRMYGCHRLFEGEQQKLEFPF